MGVLRRGGSGRDSGPTRRSGEGSRRCFLARDAGMVTAEFAVVTMAIVVVAAIVLSAVAVTTAEVRVQEAARAGARAASRGDPNAAVVAAALRSAPGSRVSISRSGSAAAVTVAGRVQLLPGLNLPGNAVRATSVADLEHT